MLFYKMVELKEGKPVQYLGVYILRWKQEWGQPQVGFVETGISEEDLKKKNEALWKVQYVLRNIRDRTLPINYASVETVLKFVDEALEE